MLLLNIMKEILSLGFEMQFFSFSFSTSIYTEGFYDCKTTKTQVSVYILCISYEN